jgi:hypothetical protein
MNEMNSQSDLVAVRPSGYTHCTTGGAHEIGDYGSVYGLQTSDDEAMRILINQSNGDKK